MMSRIKKYKKLLENFATLPKNIQKIIINNSDQDFTKLICEICLNIEKGTIKIDAENQKKFKKKKRGS